MSETSNERFEFVFKRKPKPVPGDLRIAWRLSVTLLALLYSRRQKASFAKLHMLNDAMQSDASKQKLTAMIEDSIPYVKWRMRVEPAFSRNLDILVGEGFAKWLVSSGKTSLELTPTGKTAATVVDESEGALEVERQFLSSTGKLVTEAFVQNVIAAANRSL